LGSVEIRGRTNDGSSFFHRKISAVIMTFAVDATSQIAFTKRSCRRTSSAPWTLHSPHRRPPCAPGSLHSSSPVASAMNVVAILEVSSVVASVVIFRFRAKDGVPHCKRAALAAPALAVAVVGDVALPAAADFLSGFRGRQRGGPRGRAEGRSRCSREDKGRAESTRSLSPRTRAGRGSGTSAGIDEGVLTRSCTVSLEPPRTPWTATTGLTSLPPPSASVPFSSLFGTPLYSRDPRKTGRRDLSMNSLPGLSPSSL